MLVVAGALGSYRTSMNPGAFLGLGVVLLIEVLSEFWPVILAGLALAVLLRWLRPQLGTLRCAALAALAAGCWAALPYLTHGLETKWLTHQFSRVEPGASDLRSVRRRFFFALSRSPSRDIVAYSSIHGRGNRFGHYIGFRLSPDGRVLVKAIVRVSEALSHRWFVPSGTVYAQATIEGMVPDKASASAAEGLPKAFAGLVLDDLSSTLVSMTQDEKTSDYDRAIGVLVNLIASCRSPQPSKPMVGYDERSVLADTPEEYAVKFGRVGQLRLTHPAGQPRRFRLEISGEAYID